MICHVFNSWDRHCLKGYQCKENQSHKAKLFGMLLFTKVAQMVRILLLLISNKYKSSPTKGALQKVLGFQLVTDFLRPLFFMP